MNLGCIRETAPHERRVALTPESSAKLAKAGHRVLIEAGAGEGAHFADQAYREAGGAVLSDAASVLAEAEALLKVQPPSLEEASLLREGSILVSLLPANADPALLARLAERKVSAFGLERLPRITRAQPMDVLSSQSTVAGYKAVLIAAGALGKLFPLLMTAAGTLAPARAFVLGAGVAGLQAIATARRLGAVVTAFDVRPAVKEQVESLGARFLAVELAQKDTEDRGGYAKQLSQESHRLEEELLRGALKEMDIVITTALIPGKPAPRLISEEMVRGMQPGSVIVDLAAEAGGNCELTRAGEVVVRHDVEVHGPLNLPSSVPTHASLMYSRNVAAFFLALLEDGRPRLDFKDELLAATCVVHAGLVRAKG